MGDGGRSAHVNTGIEHAVNATGRIDPAVRVTLTGTKRTHPLNARL